MSTGIFILALMAIMGLKMILENDEFLQKELSLRMQLRIVIPFFFLGVAMTLWIQSLSLNNVILCIESHCL